MPPTKSQILAEQQAKLDAAFINPDITDKRHLLVQLAEVQSVMSANNPTSSGGTPTDITAGIDGSADIDLIKQLLTDIKLELVNSKSIADLLIQDSGTTPRYFVRQDAIDQTTGTPTITILNFDGSIPSPVPVLPLVPIKAGATNQVVEDLYIATIAGSGYAIGDSLSNVKLINGETGLIVASLWYNLTSGQTIATPPPIANLKGYADKVEELLVSIASKLPTLGLNTAANSLPVSLPSDGVLPLPTGAATALLQGDAVTKLTNIDTKLDTLATAAKQTDTLTVLGAIATSNATPNIRPLTATDVVTVVVPNTVATTAKQDVTNLALADLGAKLDAIGQIEAQISAKLPPTLGTKPAAQSLSVAIAPDTAIPLAIDASTATLQGLLNQSIGPYGDSSIPIDETVDAAIAGLLRLMLQRDRATSTEELTAIGDYLNDNVAADPAEIANLKSLLRGFWKASDPSATRSLIAEIVTVLTNGQQVSLIGNLPTDPAKGALQATANTLLNTIATNTGRISQYQFQFAEDSTGTVFVARYDTSTGTFSNFTIGGATYTPIGAIDIVASGAANLTLQVNEFEAATTVAGQWNTNAILTRVLAINNTTLAVAGTIWQGASGVTLTTIPVVGVDVIDTDKQQLAILRSIDNKTVAAAPTTKTTIVGFTTVNNLVNNNLLDPTGAGGWTDVRAFQSCELTYAAGSTATFFFGGVQSAIDSTGTGANASQLVTAFNPSNGTVDTTTSVTSLGSIKLKYDLTGVAFIRVQFAAPLTNGHRITGVFSPFATTNRVLAQIAGTVPVVTVGTTTIASQIPQPTFDLTGAIASSQVSAAISINPGQSYQITINVGSITGTLAQSIVRLQESGDTTNSIWRTVYTFEPITVANGNRAYKSPVITASGNKYRLIEGVSGIGPSINRSVIRSTINAPGLINQDTRSQTIYNANLASIDAAAYGVIRAITVTPTVATPLWLQIHDTVNPIAAGAQPKQSIRIPVDGLVLGSAYFGDNGRQLGSASDPRIGISTSANGYTAIALAANTVQLYVESI